MIKEVSGDILHSKAQVIAHGVAPFDHFDNGLALSLRERWPDLFREFRQHCRVHHPKPGDTWLWAGDGKTSILNLMTQEEPDGQGHSGKPGRASVINVNRALHELRKVLEKESIRSVALPRLATGVGGLDWDEVRPMIYEILGDADADVFVYTTYVKDLPAAETSN